MPKRTARFHIVFERLGQNAFPTPIDIEVKDHEDRLTLAVEVAGAVHKHAKRFLVSKWFDVEVDMDTMKGRIEAGRFGSFTLERVL